MFGGVLFLRVFFFLFQGGREGQGRERGGREEPTTALTPSFLLSFFLLSCTPAPPKKKRKKYPGGYECVSDIKDECAADHGGCWRKEYTIRGKRTLVSACHDRLAEFKDAAAHGRLTPDFKLSECRCPPCFTEFKQNGRTECVPKCDLDSCEEKTGVCTAGGGGGRGRGSAATIWASAGVAFVALAAVAAGGYVAYRARIRAAMAAEVRSILSQYMELPSDAGSGGGGAGANGNGNGNGFGRGTIDDTGF